VTDLYRNCIWESQGEEMDVECKRLVGIMCSEHATPSFHFRKMHVRKNCRSL